MILRPVVVALVLAAFFAGVVAIGLWVGRIAGERLSPPRAVEAPASAAPATPAAVAAAPTPATPRYPFLLPYAPATPLEMPGPFRLTDHERNTVTEASLRSHYSLVLFGYTNCGRYCEFMLESLNFLLEELGTSADAIQVYFISVDPRRDSREAMARYLEGLHQNVRGLTGTDEQVAQALAAFGVSRSEQEARPPNPGEYIVEHVGIVFFLGRDGRYKLHFAEGTPAFAMAPIIRGNW